MMGGCSSGIPIVPIASSDYVLFFVAPLFRSLCPIRMAHGPYSQLHGPYSCGRLLLNGVKTTIIALDSVRVLQMHACAQQRTL